MLFETLIAFSKMSLRHNISPEHRMTSDIWSHVSYALRQLQQSLTGCPSQPREAMILSAYYLAALCQAAGDLQSFRVHCVGLKHLVSLGLPSELSTNSGFLLARLGSTEIYTRYLTEMENIDMCASADRYVDSSCRFQLPGRLNNDFKGLIQKGELTDKGYDFLRNTEKFLGRAYSGSLADKMTTLLTLRLVEASHVTTFPAHALFTQEAPTGN